MNRELGIAALLLLGIAAVAAPEPAKVNPVPNEIWKNHKRFPGGGGEMTPFIFKGKNYRLENVMTQPFIPGKPIGPKYREDHFRIRDEQLDVVISVPLMNHYFGTAYVHNGTVYAFSAAFDDNPWWKSKRITLTQSKDLIGWTSPVTAIVADKDEILFNNAVTEKDGKFYMLYEYGNGREYYKFKFAESSDLVNWKKIPGAIFNPPNCSGAPGFYYCGGYFYLTYLNIVGNKTYDTRIARSKDLRKWEMSDIPVLSPNPKYITDPVNHPGINERNAGDAEFLERDGKVFVYWCGGNQAGVCDSQRAEFTGTLQQLFESFFPKGK